MAKTINAECPACKAPVEMSVLGFTGTSRGMTEKQRLTVRKLFMDLNLAQLHHGDCIGADLQAHDLARGLRARISIHPPEDSKKRAFCIGAHKMLSKLPYLKRNRNIVARGVDGLIAAPKDYVDKAGKPGEGTWTTVGYARQAGRRILIVYPDGSFDEEVAR